MSKVDDAAQTMIANLEEKTGRSIDQWVALVAGSGQEKHGQIVKWLKTEQGLTHGYANLVAHQAKSSAAAHSADDDLVAGQYSGKESLRPIYDALVAAIRDFGTDVELAPKKAYVSLRRAKQFGLVQPSTKTRVDVGIKLPDTEPAGRLEASGSFNAMVSHRVRVSSADEVDAELVGWLKSAYDAAG